MSPSTVSRSLNGNTRISKEIRERIHHIPVEYGFAFDTNARSLITRKAGYMTTNHLDSLGHTAILCLALDCQHHLIGPYLSVRESCGAGR